MNYILLSEYLVQHEKRQLDHIYVVHQETQGCIGELEVIERQCDLDASLDERMRILRCNREPWALISVYEIDIKLAREWCNSCDTIVFDDYGFIGLEKPIYEYSFARQLDEYSVDMRNGVVYE